MAFIIKQITFDDSTPIGWSEEYFNSLINTSENMIIGFLMTKEHINLYLHKRLFSRYKEITLKKIQEYFLNKQRNYIFYNIPIDLWLESKSFWISKIANEITKNYGKSYDDAVSDIYFTILKLYRNEKVYMGNLNYVKKAIITDIQQEYRYDIKRLYGKNPMLYSLDDDNFSENGEIKNLHELLGYEDEYHKDNSYADFEKDIKLQLKNEFSTAEIREIINLANRPQYDCQFLPPNLYRRLLVFRKKLKIQCTI